MRVNNGALLKSVNLCFKLSRDLCMGVYIMWSYIVTAANFRTSSRESFVIGLRALIGELAESLPKRGKLAIYENTVSLPNGFAERSSSRRHDRVISSALKKTRGTTLISLCSFAKRTLLFALYPDFDKPLRNGLENAL